MHHPLAHDAPPHLPGIQSRSWTAETGKACLTNEGQWARERVASHAGRTRRAVRFSHKGFRVFLFSTLGVRAWCAGAVRLWCVTGTVLGTADASRRNVGLDKRRGVSHKLNRVHFKYQSPSAK